MRFAATALADVTLVRLERIGDARGWFARSFCIDEFRAAGIDFAPVQMNVSYNAERHTLRGLHYQAAPAGEPKLVRCVRGRIYDVAVDLRPDSPTFRGWTARTLDAEDGDALYVPVGCAHGFLTLEPDCEIFYVMGARYAPDKGRGVRWDDPAFGIDWPAHPAVISERDAGYPDFRGGA